MSDGIIMGKEMDIQAMKDARDKFRNCEKLNEIEEMFLNKYFELPKTLREDI